MKLHPPQIREFMTRTPHTIGADQPVEQVQAMMHKLSVRHLPVRKSGQVIGIISDRNVKEALMLPEKARLTAEDIMMPEPFRVPPQIPLHEVAAAMAEEKYGSVLIQEETGELVGIFTAVDACRALRQILQTIYET